MATVRKIKNNEIESDNEHELGGTLGMAAGGVVGGAAAGVAAATTAATIGGLAAGPVGAVAGAALGGAIGGKLGEAAARQINPTEEERYWETNYRSRPYVTSESDFETYRPAYRYGIESYSKYQGRSFNEIESDLDRGWANARGTSSLEWNRARDASRDAYDRISMGDKISGNLKEAGGFLKEETGEIINDKEMMDNGRDLRNEGRIEKGKAPKLTEPGTGH